MRCNNNTHLCSFCRSACSQGQNISPAQLCYPKPPTCRGKLSYSYVRDQMIRYQISAHTLITVSLQSRVRFDSFISKRHKREIIEVRPQRTFSMCVFFKDNLTSKLITPFLTARAASSLGNSVRAVRVRDDARAGAVAADCPCDTSLSFARRKQSSIDGEVSVSVAQCRGVRSVGSLDGWNARESVHRPWFFCTQ